MNRAIYNMIFLFFIFQSLLLAGKPIDKDNAVNHPWASSYNSNGLGRIGQYGFPSNPMNDRARGYLLKGKAQSAITNYGRIIDWDHHPPGLWGNFTYLPAVAFVAGVPGQSYTYNYDWYECPGIDHSANDFVTWCSADAYQDPNNNIPSFSWYENGDTNFVSVVFNAYNDDGTLGTRLCSPNEIDEGTCFDDEGNQILVECDFTDVRQFCLNDTNLELMISLEKSTSSQVDPNNANVYGDDLLKSGVGLVYPWAMRPSLKQRLDDFDLYNYGDDLEDWTADDEYDYYGSNTAESWFTRWSPSSNTDWHATTGARTSTHNTIVNESDVFGDINYLDTGTYPVLAHSENSSTWPTDFNEDGEIVPVWPGWFAETYDPELAAEQGQLCGGAYSDKRYNDECWVDTDRFISDNDIYMEFDDRWAHRGNMVTNNEYEQTGYPMGMRVMAEAHSYGISFAEDIIFVTVQVRNESGDWCAFERDRNGSKIYITDDDGFPVCGEGMIMPDGTKLNRGRGFDYKGTSMGFYMDADVVTSNKFGSFGVHSNGDDFMEYYDCKNGAFCPGGLEQNQDGCCDVVNDDTLRVSIAMIYDYSGGPPEDIGIVATQLLDSPYATVPVDLNNDGINDIYPGDKLKMTDWHWFSWYTRPGVLYDETAGGYAGNPGVSQARNKEDIMYKIIAGDTTNLSSNERDWYFHTANPDLDSHETDLNPHFDSLEGLAQTSFFDADEDGLDCVLQMSSGPFSLEVGEQAPFSFCIIFGQNYDDLIENATFAQLMYNSHYQGYTAPDTPKLTATIGQSNDDSQWYDGQHHCIELSWDDSAESSNDVVTGYSDFEGYNIYKSEDGGQTWGDPSTDLYDVNDPDSWVPYATFHLTEEQDIKHCTFANDYHDECSISFPEYYILNECYTDCIDQGIEEDCKNQNWVDCIDNSACEKEVECSGSGNESCVFECDGNFDNGCIEYSRRVEVVDFNLLSDDEQAYYMPIFGVVNCDTYPWCPGGDLCDDGIPDIRGYNVCGADVHNPIAGPNALGDCNAKDPETDEELGLKHSLLDCDVIDGKEYTYTITAFDAGIAEDQILDTSNLEQFGTYGYTDNPANPLHFASPDGYQSIHSSKGRNITDDNFVTVESGSNSTQNMSNNINVVPNPYFVHSNFNETEYKRQIRFTHLPEKCKITIFTISGEKVISLNHNDENDGNHWWNLRTVNNQEVAPGLYVFTVENLTPGFTNEKFVGKFAIVR